MPNMNANNPMDRTQDLARVKDVNAAKTDVMRVVSTYRIEQDALKSAGEKSYKTFAALLASERARTSELETAMAAHGITQAEELFGIRQRLYRLEHPWRMRWARVLVWYYARVQRKRA